jgi:hypothetical protein
MNFEQRLRLAGRDVYQLGVPANHNGLQSSHHKPYAVTYQFSIGFASRDTKDELRLQ